ncbi:ChuX/HutX family heme-like substrate-binding protein [Mixta sp. Marseille-Q2659]|uniref:hemin-degrading factor n=1 Tax=Mixta sp. Marseille-Q2659 TaxID=2736607 RepID=UPI0023B9B3B2|nr:ChuX/HutX family heme-like substrate-binding protein [Mixta sp. Marseille-Q2659]
MNPHYSHYLALKMAHPKKYARELAALMGLSEAELTLARTDADALSLKADIPAILAALESVGEIKSITRNEYAVHEQIGTFSNLHLGGHAGLVLNPRALDLRLFPAQWHSAFALAEQTDRGVRHSLQFFDRQGDAVLKVYATVKTDMAAWTEAIARFRQTAPGELMLSAAPMPELAEQTDHVALEQEWRAMTDVHQFFGLLKRHRLSRQQAFRAVSDDLACQIGNDALAQLLTQAQQDGNEIMIFVGNRGCTQIFTGVIEKLMPTAGWLNVFNAAFTLHLMSDRIHESWITRKPTKDGIVTSLELFAEDGTQIAQLYGQRTEGMPEQAQWRRQIMALSDRGEAA